MKSEIRTAIIMGIIIVAAIGGLGVSFSSLESPNSNKNTHENPQILSIDKSKFDKAPELAGIAGYINTSPEDLKNQIKGKVVLYDIWTYSCINCQRTLP